MNPYIIIDKPEKKRSWGPTVLFLVALVGWFLPWGGEGFKIPIIDDADPAKTEGSWVVVVEQTEDRTPDVARILSNINYWKSFEKRGLKWRHYDYDADEAEAYRPKADEVGLPATIIVGGKGDILGKVLAAFRLPTDLEVLDTKVTKATAR